MFMKTYNEMTESVLMLSKARAEAQKRKRSRVFCLVGAMTCVALVLATAMGAGRMGRPTESAPQETENHETMQPAAREHGATVYLLSSVKEQNPLKDGVTTPTNWLLRVRDVRGLSEAEQEKALREEQAFADALFENPPWRGFRRYSISSRAIITNICYGGLTVNFDDFYQISSWDVETTEGGTTGRSHWYSRDGMRGGIDLDWNPSPEVVEMLDKEPDTPLSTIQDTIVLTINYEDGSQEIFTFYITLNDEGQVFVTQKRTLV